MKTEFNFEMDVEGVDFVLTYHHISSATFAYIPTNTNQGSTPKLFIPTFDPIIRLKVYKMLNTIQEGIEFPGFLVTAIKFFTYQRYPLSKHYTQGENFFVALLQL